MARASSGVQMSGAPGQQIRTRLVQTNAFELKWNASKKVYHYDVVIKPLFKKRDDSKIDVGHNKGTELMMRLQKEIDPRTFDPLGAYDGKKNLFTYRRYSFAAKLYEVPWDARPLKVRGREQRKASIEITLVREIDVSVLKELTKGNTRALELGGIALNMLNLFLQSAPRTQDTLHNARSFFTNQKSRALDRVRPFELWRGYFQSVRPGIERIIVNIDCTTGVVMPAKRLEDVCLDYLRLRNLRDLFQLDRTQIAKLRLYLRDIKVEIALPVHAGTKPKKIRDILGNVDAITFDKDGETITIKDHFRRTHNHDIPRGCPGVKFGGNDCFPITVCRTVQQLYKNKAGLSPDLIREVLEFTPPNPTARLQAITAGWSQLQYQSSEFLLGAGITVEREPLKIEGRLLPPPNVGFGGGQRIAVDRPGVWDIMNKRLLRPAQFPERWAVVNLSPCDMSVVGRFIEGLQAAMRNRGMSIYRLTPSDVLRGNGHVFLDKLEEAVRGGAKMILVILPESAAGLYSGVKRWGDITRGVITQCVKMSGKLTRDVTSGSRSVDQYYNNLILKINARLGGTNGVPFADDLMQMSKIPTMVLGADVSHPGPGSQLPSVSALVASADMEYLRYVAFVRIQEKRTEMIVNLKEMCKGALETFRKVQRCLPQRILMLRDGVSEGEFMAVKELEVAQLREAIGETYGPTNKWPMLIWIVVGKRHHFRFFPMDGARPDDPKGNGNLPAGLIIDKVITHPVYDDFYLQSQPGLKGTSRPSHYTILENDDKALDFKANPERLQRIMFALCHCYSRATRSVKIPAPVYYADLVCRRAKFHFDEGIGYEDFDARSAHSDDSDGRLNFFKEHFQDINDQLKYSMYFV